MTLESKLRALVAEWRGATKAISADGASRPLEWEGKDMLRLCADRIEALLAEHEKDGSARLREFANKLEAAIKARDFTDDWTPFSVQQSCSEMVHEVLEDAMHVPAEALLAERQEPPLSEDSFRQGVLFAANFLEREADANFMPNEPAKVLLKVMASALRINMRVSGFAAAAQPSSGTGENK